MGLLDYCDQCAKLAVFLCADMRLVQVVVRVRTASAQIVVILHLFWLCAYTPHPRTSLSLTTTYD